MALKIKNMYGVICIKGNVSGSHEQEVKGYFKALLRIQKSININLCEVKKGKKRLTNLLDTLQKELTEEQSLHYYSCPGDEVEKLYEQLNDPVNFYRLAA